jgi:diguanylate cyclase (GGDEF)-like protein
MNTRIRAVIQFTGLIIAAVVGLAVPLAFALQQFRHARQHAFEGAERAAEHITLEGIGLLAVLCGLLGIGVLVGIRALLRIDQAHARDEASRILREQNLDAALNNMSEGLCMFDGQKRLVICNARYATMYGLPPRLTKPGTSLVEILEYRVRAGTSYGDPETFIADRLASVNAGIRRSDIIEQNDGRTIEILFDPLPGGGWVTTHEDITERRSAEARIAYLATHDTLTDLPNRVLLRENIEAGLARLASGGSFAVHFLDLDRFKDVNDTFGHSIGDALLKQVAERLLGNVREECVVARLGGDEFAIVQSELDGPEAASALAARIIRVVSAPYDIDGHEILIGTSIGVALAPGDGMDADRLLKNADLALYRAKLDEKGTFRFFEREMDERMQTRRLLEAELRAALGNGELEVYYQPVLDFASGAISGFEALLRWKHPRRGMVSPVEFIPVAEDTGLIVPIGEWVLRQACAEGAKWPAPIRVAVNLSAVQFKNRNLAGTVMSALAAAGLPPNRLELEITESVLLLESESIRSLMHKLRELGVRIALDDFGTGYSSLSYLRSFPFDNIKIDHSFVRDLSTRADSVAIVHAITELARSLRMTTTAEGVETQEHFDMLRSEGCTEMQGFLISEPQPAEAIPALLAKYNRKSSVVSAPGGNLVQMPRKRI